MKSNSLRNDLHFPPLRPVAVKRSFWRASSWLLSSGWDYSSRSILVRRQPRWAHWISINWQEDHRSYISPPDIWPSISFMWWSMVCGWKAGNFAASNRITIGLILGHFLELLSWSANEDYSCPCATRNETKHLYQCYFVYLVISSYPERYDLEWNYKNTQRKFIRILGDTVDQLWRYAQSVLTIGCDAINLETTWIVENEELINNMY